MSFDFNCNNTFSAFPQSCGGFSNGTSLSSTSYGDFSSGISAFTPMMFMPLMNFSTMPLFGSPKFSTKNYCHTKFKKMEFSAESNRMIEEMSQRVGCKSKDLKNIMYSESGGNPHAVNPNGGATGLIQFTPRTARSLGTSVEALAQMTTEQQLPYVEKYLQQNKKHSGFAQDAKIDSGTLYSLVFLPAYANKEVLCGEGSKYYDANRGLDKNNDGLITKSDLADRLSRYS